MNSFVKSADAPLAASGGLEAPRPALDDPCQALDELMSVVEALCPVWSERPTFSDNDRFLL